MDISDILAGENAHLKTKEAEALEILGVHTIPAMKTLDGLKREFGHVVPSRELGMLVSPAEGELYKDGKRKATRILFDAYAEVAFRQIRDPEAFNELLGAIHKKVAATLTFPSSDPDQPKVSLIDKYEAERCRLAWVRAAWERARPGPIRLVWRKILAFWSRGAPSGRPIPQPAAAEKMSAAMPVKSDDAPQSVNVEPIEETPPAQPVTPVSGENGADQRAAIDTFIRKLAGTGRKITRKDIWTAAGYEDPTEFERFQRGDIRTTRSAAVAFTRVLRMKPKDFIQLLDRKSAPK
jgi:hypothetical protein